MNVLYVDYDADRHTYMAVCDDDRVVLLVATTPEQAEQEADELSDEFIYDES